MRVLTPHIWLYKEAQSYLAVSAGAPALVTSFSRLWPCITHGERAVLQAMLALALLTALSLVVVGAVPAAYEAARPAVLETGRGNPMGHPLTL